MGIFDIIELKNHLQAIGEYLFYVESHPDEMEVCCTLMKEHIKKSFTILDKLEK